VKPTKDVGCNHEECRGYFAEDHDWWDGLNLCPKDVIHMDREDIPEIIKNESKGY
jgi:hypothetical protein